MLPNNDAVAVAVELPYRFAIGVPKFFRNAFSNAVAFAGHHADIFADVNDNSDEFTGSDAYSHADAVDVVHSDADPIAFSISECVTDY